MADLETKYGEDAAQALYMWRFAGVSFGLEARLGGRRDRRSPPALAGIDEVTREAVASAIGYGGSGSGDRLPDAPRRLRRGARARWYGRGVRQHLSRLTDRPGSRI